MGWCVSLNARRSPNVKKKQNRKYQAIRSKYQKKRSTKKWKLKKKNALLHRRNELLHRKDEYIRKKKEYKAKPFIKHKAPDNMSFIDNTDGIIKYFNDAGKSFEKEEKVEFDIKNVMNLTPDTITLMIAKIHDSNFTKKGELKGAAPSDPKLRQLFLESGFYDFVRTSKRNKGKSTNLLHKETGDNVRPNIAKKACIFGMKHSLQNTEPFEPLYEILIECMQNTNNHASPDDKEKCKWWLFVYNCKETDTSKYSFLDLGVGIFESMIVRNYIEKLMKQLGARSNEHYVKDLLNGTIQSRISEDNAIRGKGIPQIVSHSNSEEFVEFKIITNDVKIDVKNDIHEKLRHNFSGTFYYWEIKRSYDGNKR